MSTVTPVRNHPPVAPGDRVRVYRNRTKHQWSVQRKTPDGWRVVAKLEELTLIDPVFRMSVAGRDRARAKQQRNVHAIVEGTVLSLDALEHPERLRIRYHYAETNGFETPNGTPVSAAESAVFDSTGTLWVIGGQS